MCAVWVEQLSTGNLRHFLCAHRMFVYPSLKKRVYGPTGYGCESCLWSAKQFFCLFPVPLRASDFWSRDRFGGPGQRQPAHSPHTLRLNLVLFLWDSLFKIPRRRGVYLLLLYRQGSVIGSSVHDCQVYQVTRLPSLSGHTIAKFIRSRNNCVPMAFTAESPPARGQ